MQVLSLCGAVEKSKRMGVIGCVPAYCTLLVTYDPLILSYQDIYEFLSNLEPDEKDLVRGRIVPIPVCYGGTYGPDLGEVAAYTGLTKEMVILRHTGRLCRVYLLGFRPGFPYLGGMDESISVPRRATPRTTVAAGSVGIAGKQTGIYPETSPGGWNIIGRTPLHLFSEQEGALLHPGDRLHFRAISEEEFMAFERDAGLLAAWMAKASVVDADGRGRND